MSVCSRNAPDWGFYLLYTRIYLTFFNLPIYQETIQLCIAAFHLIEILKLRKNEIYVTCIKFINSVNDDTGLTDELI